jgi:Leucine-rich repeat (LRR) protein
MKNKNVLFLFLGLIFICTFLGTPFKSTAATGDVVLFADPDLEEAVRQALTLTVSEPLINEKIQGLVALEAESLEIESLKGLEKAINLEELYLSDNLIEDITPILGLKKLSVLDLSYNPLEEIRQLSLLQSLTEIDFSATNITNLYPLVHLANLHYVNIMDLPIHWNNDRGAWDVLSQLEEAGVYVESPPYGPVEIIEIFASESAARIEWDYHGDWAENTTFKISVNGVNKGTTREESFTVKGLKANSENTLTISVIKDGLEASEELSIEFTTEPVPSGKVISFEDKVLEAFVKEELLVYNRSLQDSDMKSLTEFYVEEDQGVRSLKGLEYATNLVVLDIHRNLVVDLSPLANLKELQYLDIEGNDVADLRPISKLTNIESLFISGTDVKDLIPLKSLPNLKELLVNTMYEINWKTDLTAGNVIKDLIARGVDVSVFEVTEDRLNSSTFEFTWYYNGAEPVTYELYMNDELLAEFDSTTQYYKVTGLKPGHGYQFRLEAIGDEEFYDVIAFGAYPQSWWITGWSKFDGKWYYFDPKTGQMKKGWLLDGSKWYYLDANGIMKTGWLQTGGKWYYLNGDGSMKTGWLSYGGNWYFLEGSGAMKTGWLSTGGKWYYLNSQGAMLKSWQLINKKWYYFYGSGEMAKSTVIGGYRLGADGAMI